MRDTFLPFCRSTIGELDIAAVVDALRTDRLGPGPVARAFEQRFAARSRVAHAIALNGGGAAMRLVFEALGAGPGDDILVPACSAPAVLQAVRRCGATPIVCAVEPRTLCVSVRTVAAALTQRTRAIVVTGFAGRPAHVLPIATFAHDRGIAVIEDAIAAAGMLDDGHWAGTYGAAAVYRFSAASNITTGEGGMVLTNDGEIAARVRALVAAGSAEELPDLCAALGIAQFDRLDALQARREEVAAQYLAALAQIDGVEPAAIDEIELRDRHSWCFFPVAIDPALGIARDAVVDALREANIGADAHHPHIISLPVSAAMSDDDVEDVVQALAAATKPLAASA